MQTSPQYISQAEGRIAFEVQGAGPLVILVPGMGELRSSYRFLVPELVASGYRVASTDLRGHGDSDASFSSYGDVATASDISALIDTLGGPAVVAGNSLAAGSAVLVAAARPEMVVGLVLIGPFVRNAQLSAADAAEFEALTAPDGVADRWRDFMPLLYAGRKPDDFESYRAAVHSSLARSAFGSAFSSTVRGADHTPAEQALGKVSAPTLVVMGDSDPDFPDPAGEAAWISAATQAEVVMINDAGHYPQAQQPEQTGAAILSFLSGEFPPAWADASFSNGACKQS
jgi:pimeloyl-ACP methyl ester carboxylesterase